MSDFLVGRGLTDEQLVVLEATTSTEEVRALLASPDYFNVENFNKDERRRAIALDFHFYNYDFCKKTGLTHEATALFLKIMQITFSNDTNPPPSRTPTMENSFDAFVQLVLKHSVQNAPFQVLVFQREHMDQVQLTLVTDIYITLTTIHLTPTRLSRSCSLSLNTTPTRRSWSTPRPPTSGSSGCFNTSSARCPASSSTRHLQRPRPRPNEFFRAGLPALLHVLVLSDSMSNKLHITSFHIKIPCTTFSSFLSLAFPLPLGL